jgi:hypothetical protein
MSKHINLNDFVSQYVTYEEVHSIKQAFDLFDRDLGGAIDPKGTLIFMQNLRLPSTHSELRPGLKLSIK